MATDTLTAFEPRKTPVQERAAVTVEAIAEATVQVLLTHGSDRLTTTRVAERAGVAVGTLYQYFPNKQSLLFAVLKGHLKVVSDRVEAACERAKHEPLSEMIRQMVEAYVGVKMERSDISVALYQIAPDVGGPALMKRVLQRLRKAVEAMLETAPDMTLPPDKFAVEMMLAAISGAMRSVLEAGASPALMRRTREQLVLLCQSYLTAATGGRL